MRIRIEWCHCDPAQIIFNPHYYIWMDMCTHALLKTGGLDIAETIAEPDFMACPLVTSSAQFHTPAFFGDEVLLSSSASKFGNTSFDVEHRFTRRDTLLCTGREVRVWGGKENGKLVARPVPDWIRENLSTNEVVDVSV